MRIGYYIPAWPPGSTPNGIVTTLGHLGKQLREMGHDVFYVTSVAASGFCERGMVKLVKPKRKSLSGRIHFKLDMEAALYREQSEAIADAFVELFNEEGLEIFQMEETQGFVQAIIARASIPVVVRLHGPWFLNRDLGLLKQEKSENRNRVEREGRAILAASALTAPSRNVLDSTKAHYDRLPSITQVIPNPMAARRSSECWTLGNCNTNEILFVGRFDQIKGADVLLRAFGKMALVRRQLRLTFVGPDIGLLSDTNESLNFATFCAKELSDEACGRIDFRGPLPRDQIENLRTRAYVTVVASRYENFGNVVLEAMAAGCPIVATRTGGTPEMIVHDRNGLLVPPDDVAALVHALSLLFDKPQLAARLGKQAVADCRDLFQPQEIAEKTLNFYSKVIKSRRE